MVEVLKEALRLRKLGLAIHWLRGLSKAPVLDGWSNAPVMTEAELKASYHSGLNVGFRPGKWSVVNGKEVCVLDVDIRGGPAYAAEAYAAARAMLGDDKFDVLTGSGVGRHRFLKFPIGASPAKSATTLRQSDVWVQRRDGRLCKPGDDGGRPAWVIEILSTGKNVVLPPSIHPDTGQPYKFIE